MQIVNTVLYVVFLAVLALFTLRGYKKGAIKEGLRSGAMILSMLLALIVSSNMFSVIAANYFDKPIVDIVSEFGLSLDEKTTEILNSLDPDTLSYIIAVPICLVAMPLCFVLVYFISRPITAIIAKIAYKFIPEKFNLPDKATLKAERKAKREERKAKRKAKKEGGASQDASEKAPFVFPVNRAIGAAVGAVNAMILIGIILFPIAGLSGIAKNVMRSAESNHSDSSTVTDLAAPYHEYVEPIANNAVISTSSALYSPIYKTVTGVKVEGKRVPMKMIVSDAFEIIILAEPFGEGADISKFTEEQIEALSAIISKASANRYMAAIVSDVFGAVTRNIDLDMLGIDADGPVADLVNEILNVFRTSNINNFESDFKTLINIVSIVARAGLFEGEPNIEALFVNDKTGKSPATMIIDELSDNPRFNTICTRLTEMAMALIIENADVDPEVVETVEKVVSDVKVALNNVIAIDKNECANEEEYKQKVVDEVKVALVDNGLDLDEIEMEEEDRAELESTIADVIIKNIDEVDEITDAELATIMLQYYSEYMSSADEIPSDGIGTEIGGQ